MVNDWKIFFPILLDGMPRTGFHTLAAFHTKTIPDARPESKQPRGESEKDFRNSSEISRHRRFHCGSLQLQDAGSAALNQRFIHSAKSLFCREPYHRNFARLNPQRSARG
jgi:hypothetical protein